MLDIELRFSGLLLYYSIEIEMHPNNMNREDGLILSTAWKPLLHTQKEQQDKQTIQNNPTAKPNQPTKV
jgi:hypothetical protein